MGKSEREYVEYKPTELIEIMPEGEEKEKAYQARTFDNMLGWIINSKGFKKTDLAERAEVDYREIQRYLEIGSRTHPQQPTVIRLAMALEVPLIEANRLLGSANCGKIVTTNAETRIIKKHYNAIINEFSKHRDDPQYVCESILKLNKELEATEGCSKLFKDSRVVRDEKGNVIKGRESKYDNRKK